MKHLLFFLLLFPFFSDAQSISIAANDTTICLGSVATFTASTSATTPHYQWLVNGINVGGDSAGLVSNSLSTGDTVACQLVNAAHDSVYATSCSIITIVQNMPFAGTIICADTFICIGSTIKLIDSTTGGKWIERKGFTRIDSAGNLTAIRDDGFECPQPGLDTIYYVVTNSCGADSAKKSIVVHSPPSAFFELHDYYGHVYLYDAVTCVPPVPSGYYYGLVVTNGYMEIMCEGEIHPKHDFVEANAARVVGLKPGVDTVVCISTNVCGTATYSMKVTVIEGPHAVSVTRSLSELCEGETDSIIASNAPYKEVWSSKSSIALFEGIPSGLKITGTYAGLDTFKLTVSNSCGFKDTSVTVKINPTPKPIFGTDSVCKGYSIDLANSLPDGAWTSSNTGIANVHPTSGNVSGLGDGTAVIEYTLPDGCSITRQIKVTDCENELEIYPNPASDEVTIHLYVNIYQRYSVVNTLGQVLLEGVLTDAFTKVNVKPLLKGIYFLRLKGNGKDLIRKLVRD